MSRRRAAVKRSLPDAKYGDIILTKFINSPMYQGKSLIFAEGIIYGTFDLIHKKLKSY